MQVNGSMATRTKYSSWCGRDSDRLSKEIKTRQMYGESRGIQFASDTVVMKANRAAICDTQQEKDSNILKQGLTQAKPQHKVMQSSMMPYSSSTPKKSGGGFFDKIVREIEDRDTSPQTKPQKSTWTSGMGDNIPQDKRDSVQRSLKWMENLYEEPKNVETAVCVTACVESANNNPANISGAVRSDVFQSIRTRIGNLLLHELPQEVTSELRAMGRELEQLSVSVSTQ